MNKKLGFIKKIRLFSSYKKSVKSIKNILDQNFNIRIDSAYRMYTVLNVPEEIIGEAFSIKKTDIDRISENYIKEYSSELSKFLNKNGLSELFEFYEIKKVDKNCDCDTCKSFHSSNSNEAYVFLRPPNQNGLDEMIAFIRRIVLEN